MKSFQWMNTHLLSFESSSESDWTAYLKRGSTNEGKVKMTCAHFSIMDRAILKNIGVRLWFSNLMLGNSCQPVFLLS